MNLDSRIVVLGGYGAFGRRIAQSLARHPGLEIYVAGRDANRAQIAARQLAATAPQARLHGIELDYTHPSFVRQLGSIAPIVVVHAAGPYQPQDHAVAEACIACRSHYVDLADAREFVTGIRVLDRDARRRDVLIVSGASTVPGVTSAVVDTLSAGLATIDSIELAIAPARRGERGRATLASVLSYCGKPVRVLEHGAWTTRWGWQNTRRVAFQRFARRLATCDVPDLELLASRHPGIRSVSCHVGPEPAWQRLALWSMATLTRLGVVRNWSPLARLALTTDRWCRLRGGNTSALQVRVTGKTAAGRQLARCWDLTAHADGAAVPCAPAIALTRRLAAGTLTARGAMPCLGLLDWSALAAELAGLEIDWLRTDATLESGVDLAAATACRTNP